MEQPPLGRIASSPFGVVYRYCPGGWFPDQVTEEKTQLLKRALARESNYCKGVTARVRVLEIRWLSYQVVSGTLYEYEVVATPVESSSPSGGASDDDTVNDSSSRAMYAIRVYEQQWTNTLQVTKIDLVSTNIGE